MTFLFPWAAGFAALVPVVVGLYLLRQRRRRVVVPSLARWRAAHQPAPSRMAWGRVRGWRSLLLNLLILLLILLALMRPEFSAFLSPQATVVVVDSRLRMQGVGDDGTTAFERARAVAAGIAGRASESGPVSVTTMGGVASALTADPPRALAAVDDLKVSDAGGEVRVVTDGRMIFVTDRPTEIEGVEVVAVGEAAANVAVTDFALRNLPDGGQSRALFVRVRNFSDDLVKRELELRLDDRLLDVVSVEIEAGGEFEMIRSFGASELREVVAAPRIGQRRLEVTAPQGWLTGTLVGEDAIAADNVGRAVVPVGGKPRVLLVTDGNWFLENALSADPQIAFELLTSGVWRAGMELAFDAVVFDDWTPEGMTREEAEAGNFLFVGRSPWSVEGARIEKPAVTDAERESPLLAGLSLDGAVIDSAERIQGLRSVVRSVDDALVAVSETRGGRQAVFTFRPGESDLPLRVAFPLLVANTVHWLTGVAERESVRAGDVVDVDGVARDYPRAGFFGGGEDAWLAVNPASRSESDLRGAETGGAVALAVWGGWVPWKLAVVLALAALILEWVAFYRWRVR